MKKIIFSILALSLIAGCFSCQEEIDIEKEKEAIIAVIENESNYAHAGDFDNWSPLLLHNENLTVQAAGKESYRFVVGWEEISTLYKEGMEANPNPSTNIFQNTNYRIIIYQESAWATYDEIVNNSEGEFLNTNASVRFLEKVDGEWKIAFSSWLDTTSYDEAIEEDEESEIED